MQTFLSDEEREELFFLRQRVLELENENKILKTQNIIEKPPIPIIVFKDKKNRTLIGTDIEEIINQIQLHRIEKNGKCWFFGIKNSNFDYGSIWSSYQYWQNLINANPVNEKFCLFNFEFQLNNDCCVDCKNKINQIQQLYLMYLDCLKEEYKN